MAAGATLLWVLRQKPASIEEWEESEANSNIRVLKFHQAR